MFLRAWIPFVLIFGAMGLGACGARTGLPEKSPCAKPGATRACSNLCGPGKELCEGGYWQACVVPEASRACSNTCGDGTQVCVDNAWQLCEVPATSKPCESVCGPGKSVCIDGGYQPCDAPLPGPLVLTATFRDFHSTSPDFAPKGGSGSVDLGIVETPLGADGTPVYAGNPTTLTTSGQASFAAWYHDAPGINEAATIPLQFADSATYPGYYDYDNQSFFPLDGQLFGNEGDAHNYGFTFQAHNTITYAGGDVLYFASDDDLWVFINGRLALDRGGIQASSEINLDLDTLAGKLNLVKGQTYPIDFFYAERNPPNAAFTFRVPKADMYTCGG